MKLKTWWSDSIFPETVKRVKMINRGIYAANSSSLVVSF